MKKMKHLSMRYWLIATFLVISSIPVTGLTRQIKNQVKPTPVGTHVAWGKVDGVTIEGLVQGPSATVSDLQVACVFEYTDDDIFKSPPALPAALNGMVHLDKALNGVITAARKNGMFKGHAFETLLITPPAGMLASKKLLLIGLGDRDKFTPDIMTTIGNVAMNQALRLGVSNYAFASDLKDAGIDSPTALIAKNVVLGSFEAYRTQQWLKKQKMANYKPLKKIILLAGPAFYAVAGGGIKEAIAQLNK